MSNKFKLKDKVTYIHPVNPDLDHDFAIYALLDSGKNVTFGPGSNSYSVDDLILRDIPDFKIGDKVTYIHPFNSTYDYDFTIFDFIDNGKYATYGSDSQSYSVYDLKLRSDNTTTTTTTATSPNKDHQDDSTITLTLTIPSGVTLLEGVFKVSNGVDYNVTMNKI